MKPLQASNEGTIVHDQPPFPAMVVIEPAVLPRPGDRADAWPRVAAAGLVGCPLGMTPRGRQDAQSSYDALVQTPFVHAGPSMHSRLARNRLPSRTSALSESEQAQSATREHDVQHHSEARHTEESVEGTCCDQHE